MRVEIPVHFINQDMAPGIKRGGSLNIVAHSIEMLVLADAIPEYLTVDLTGLDIAKGISPSLAKRTVAMVRSTSSVRS